MKKIGLFLTTVVLAVSTVFAANIKINVNGKAVKSTVQPIQKDGTTLVPLRLISEQMGASVEWEPSEQIVAITKGGISLYMQLGNKSLIMVDEKSKEERNMQLSVAPQQVKGVTLVPLRAISEGLGCKINYTNGVIDITYSAEGLYLSTQNETYIEEDLNKKYSVCPTVAGNIKMYFWVYENVDRQGELPYDYLIRAKFEGESVDILSALNKSNPEKAKQVKAQLKDYMEKLAKEQMANHPNVKFYGMYDSTYYTDSTNEDSIVELNYCSWINFAVYENTTYAGTKVSDFTWMPGLDNEVW